MKRKKYGTHQVRKMNTFLHVHFICSSSDSRSLNDESSKTEYPQQPTYLWKLITVKLFFFKIHIYVKLSVVVQNE